MPHPTGPTNECLRDLIKGFQKTGREQGSKLLLRLAKDLSRPTRSRREVGLSTINRTLKDGETAVVPGKVLDGQLEKKVDVIAWRFSNSAAKRIENLGGKPLPLESLLKSVPEKIRIIG